MVKKPKKDDKILTSAMVKKRWRRDVENRAKLIGKSEYWVIRHVIRAFPEHEKTNNQLLVEILKELKKGGGSP